MRIRVVALAFGLMALIVGLAVAPAQAAPQPAAPKAVKATASASAGTYKVKWKKAKARGAKVTKYQVADRVKGKSWSSGNKYKVKKSKRSKTIRGTLGSVHQVRVRAKSARGWGKWSNKRTVRLVNVPSAPPSVRAVAGDAQLAVSWGTADARGSAVRGYRVYTRVKLTTWSAWTSRSVSSSTRSTKFIGLANGRALQFYVTAVNAAGASPASSIVRATPGMTIASGVTHACALTKAGGVKCWGSNSDGQLGNGTLDSSPQPVGVAGLSRDVATISAGYGHTCAVTTAAALKCWGSNGDGQLGDGTTEDSAVPVTVSGLSSGVIAVATGAGHSCAVTTTGAAKCWGEDAYGRLGNGVAGSSLTPVNVTGLTSGTVTIESGEYHTCAVTTVGAAKCWGSNSDGQLGEGTTDDSAVPVTVSGLASGVVSISAGLHHSCAVTTVGAAKCWGYNSDGQLGDGTKDDSGVPVTVSGLSSGATKVTLGSHHSCATTAVGGVKCWGYNYDGELGNGTTDDSAVPVTVSGLSSGVTTISAGDYHACAATVPGIVKCWGYNNDGQLGDGTTDESSVPLLVRGL